MQEKVLVTGGSGFIGGKVALLLAARGYGVRAFYRKGDDARLLDGSSVERIEGDIGDEALLAEAARGCAGVFHAAGNVSFREADRAVQYRVNVEGTRAVVSACRKAGVRRLVHTSTVNAIGLPLPAGSVGDESTPWSDVMDRFGYFVTKREAERIALRACGPSLDVVAVCPGTVFGPGDVNVNAGSYVLALARYPVFFYPGGGTSCAHVDAVAEGHLRAYLKGRPGRRYILGGENLTYAQMFATIADVLGRPRPRWRLPAPLAVAAAAAVEAAAGRLGVGAKLSADAARAGELTFFFSSDRAVRELGYEMIPFRRAVEDAVAWYRREGML